MSKKCFLFGMINLINNYCFMIIDTFMKYAMWCIDLCRSKNIFYDILAHGKFYILYNIHTCSKIKD